MSKLRIIKILLICTFFMTLIPVSSIVATITQTPIILIEESEGTFVPVTYGTYDYYIVPPGTSYEDIEYWGTFTDLVEYSFIDGGQNFFDFDDISPTNLIRSNLVPNNLENKLFENDTYDSNHAFFPSTYYPRAVRTPSDKMPVFNKTLQKPISLHMNYSFTFFAEDGVDYWGYVESDNPFYMDVAFSATNVYGTLSFENAYPLEPGILVGIPENKMTYPIFPMNESLLKFSLENLNGSTLVTLTPQLWDYPTRLPTLELNNLTTGVLDQGEPWYYNETTDQFIEPDNEFFSIRMFSLPLVKDKTYRISAFFDMEDVKPGVSSMEPYRYLFGDHYEKIGPGFLDQDGMIIRARETENATLVLYSPGEANGQYFIFYQELPPEVPPTTIPLTLNTNITVDYDIYYTFSLSTPSMIAINWTDTAGDLFDNTFYIPGTYSDEWTPITTDDSFFGGNGGIQGNLVGDSLGDIDANWRYIPSGSYAIKVDNIADFENEIRFTTVPIQQPGTLQMNQDSLFAIEIPVVHNRLNWVNLSTDDQITPIQQVQYEWTFVGKYNEQITAQTNWDWFGNENETANPGVWEAWDYNDSIINALLPTRDYEAPILMIRPYNAVQNATTDPLDTFAASLTVSTNEATHQSQFNINSLGGLSPFIPNIPTNYLYSVSGSQSFIPLAAISTTTSFAINDEYTTDDDQLYGIPLNLDPYSIYNISVYLIGNYSSYTPDPDPSDFLNASFYSEGYLNLISGNLIVHGGNLRSLEIFDSQTGNFDNTSEWRSLLILTVSSTSYLYVDIERQASNNATMQVVISKLSLPNLDFQLEIDYDPTISNQEVLAEELLVNEIIPPEMLDGTPTPTEFPLEVLLILGGGGAIIAGGVAAIVFVRRKRG
ncbi:MAG: hypothetical protein ACXAC8_15970 [Candidatus Hodarchaeales archaeon]|jgi:hypothetical protein